jgi:hypothetical protein
MIRGGHVFFAQKSVSITHRYQISDQSFLFRIFLCIGDGCVQIRMGNGSEGGGRDFFVTLPLACVHIRIYGVVIWTASVNLYVFDETFEQL